MEENILQFKKLQNDVFGVLKNELKHEGINIKDFKELTEEEVPEARKIFGKKIEPLLVVNFLDLDSFMNQIRSKQLYLIIETEDELYYIEIPEYLSDLYKLKNGTILRVEDIILNNLKQLFDNEKIVSYCTVKFLRSAYYDFPFCDESKMSEEVEEMLTVRETSPIISYEISDVKGDETDIVNVLDCIVSQDSFIYDINTYLNLSTLNKFKVDNEKLYYK